MTQVVSREVLSCGNEKKIREKKNLTALQLEAMVETSGSCRAWSGRAGSRAGRGDGIRGGGESRLSHRADGLGVFFWKRFLFYLAVARIVILIYSRGNFSDGRRNPFLLYY
jgi:hypothetical protein